MILNMAGKANIQRLKMTITLSVITKAIQYGKVNLMHNQTKAEQEKAKIRKLEREHAQMLQAIMDLRRAWIAPHRFDRHNAEMRLTEISDKISPNHVYFAR